MAAGFGSLPRQWRCRRGWRCGCSVAIPVQTGAYFRALCCRGRRRHPGAHIGDVVSAMGQTVVVENRPGRAAWSRRKRSWRRRRTATPSLSSRAVTPPIRSCIPNSLRHLQGLHADLAAASSPNILLVRTDSPFQDTGRHDRQARSKPGSLSFGHAGTGTSTQSGRRVVEKISPRSISMPIPYKGGAPSINDLLGGQIPMSFNNGPESGRTARIRHRPRARRHDALAGVVSAQLPSMAEARTGYDTEVWWGCSVRPACLPT